ncbi:hypothetical protein BDW72DRAFT_174027 [Aspergillus terricola var. indicus]
MLDNSQPYFLFSDLPHRRKIHSFFFETIAHACTICFGRVSYALKAHDWVICSIRS